MRRFVIVFVVAALGWYGYTRYQNRARIQRVAGAEVQSTKIGPGAAAFKCDGRTYCSQMRSCAEATFFLKNCPGTKMDGNHDGIPCEMQWCK
jgi:hypothetical protein